jgi:glucose-1-phosphate thymidylyltransferase
VKGIILAGGAGMRLYPSTNVVCKQLLPVYDKPMVYYPLSILMMAGIRDILIISTPADLPRFQNLFGGGDSLGLSFSYAEQPSPGGIAEAFIIGEKFISGDRVCLVLGDNIIYGNELRQLLLDSAAQGGGATVFGYWVGRPERYGVIELDKDNRILSIEEKPRAPKSNYAVVGLYFYDGDVVDVAKSLKPSERGEKEITDLNEMYLKRGNLRARILGRGYAWFDTGTHDSMLEAALFMKTMEDRQGLKIACIEEIAYVMGYIDAGQLERLAAPLAKSSYGEYMMRIARKRRC